MRSYPVALALAMLIARGACADESVKKASNDAERGTLCLAPSAADTASTASCRAVDGREVNVSPEAGERVYLWQSERGEVVAGTVAAGVRQLVLRRGDRAAVRLSVVTSARREPGVIGVTLANDRHRWSWRVPIKSMRNHLFQAQPGRYTIALDAEHHRRATREIALSPSGSSLQLALEPLPFVRGEVRDSSGTAVVGAEVRTPDGETLATSNAQGAFSFEVAGEAPDVLELSAAGVGTAFLPLALSGEETVLPAVTVRPGGVAAVRLSRGTIDEAVALEIRKDLAGKAAQRVARRTLEIGEQVAHFAALEPGRYLAVAEGPAPGQRAGTTFDVAEGTKTEAEIRIHRSRLVASVAQGEAPLANATIRLRSVTGRWESLLRADEAGRLSTELWQDGDFIVSVRHERLKTPYVTVQDVAAADETRWEIAVPNAAIQGQVVDRSGKAVARAQVVLQSESEQRTRAHPVSTDDAGRFEFSGVDPGQHVLSVTAAGYLGYRSDPITMTAHSKSYEVSIALDTAESARIRAVDSSLSPIAAATVIVLADGVVRTARTDHDGTAEVEVPASGEAAVYVVPQSGSFGRERVTAHNAASPAIVRVPPAVVSLRLRVRDEADAPIPGVRFVVSYERETLPELLLQLLERRHGTSFTTDGHGNVLMPGLPPGLYQLWPAVPAHLPGPGGAAPIGIATVTGEYIAEVTLERE